MNDRAEHAELIFITNAQRTINNCDLSSGFSLFVDLKLANALVSLT